MQTLHWDYKKIQLYSCGHTFTLIHRVRINLGGLARRAEFFIQPGQSAKWLYGFLNCSNEEHLAFCGECPCYQLCVFP